jgi:hypothetical protein
MGIEPTPSAWKAEVLPLNYTRLIHTQAEKLQTCQHLILVEGGGFEPPKAEPADLQSDPFDRSGTPPNKPRIIETLSRIRQLSWFNHCSDLRKC